VIDIAQKGVQRAHTLASACRHDLPFVGIEDAGNDVEGDQALDAVVVTMHGEGDAETAEQRVRPPVLQGKPVGGSRAQPFGIGAVGTAHFAVRPEHFVEHTFGHGPVPTLLRPIAGHRARSQMACQQTVVAGSRNGSRIIVPIQCVVRLNARGGRKGSAHRPRPTAQIQGTVASAPKKQAKSPWGHAFGLSIRPACPAVACRTAPRFVRSGFRLTEVEGKDLGCLDLGVSAASRECP